MAVAARPETIQDLLLGSRDAPVLPTKLECLRRFLDTGLSELHTAQVNLTTPLPSSDQIREAIDLFALNRRAGFFWIRELVLLRQEIASSDVSTAEQKPAIAAE